MTFQLPEDLAAASTDELETLHTDGLAAARAIAEISDDDLTEEQITEAETIMAGLETIATEINGRVAAASARADRLAALRTSVAEDATEEEVEEEADEEADEEAPAEQTAVPVLAAGGPAKPRTPLASVARRAPAVIIPEPAPIATGASFAASANVPGYTAGADLETFDEVTKAFQSRIRSFTAPTGKAPMAKRLGSAAAFAIPSSASRFSVAQIVKPENEFSTGADKSTAEQMQVINEAANEKRLPKGGLVAAGGWCAPSETLYDFCSLETVSGILSIPEISVSRGGINYTKGPDYAAIAADWGFLQTEAEAEAGTVKVCYEVECPPFQEIRLDAIGFCVTNGILTNVGYPELTRRILEIGAVAHAHAVNKYVLDHISTLIGAARNYTEVGSATADVLDAISLQATHLRYSYSLGESATLEVILPVWAKEIVRADLSRRNGVDMINVSDAQIQSYFSVRNLAVQWVYDYQTLPTGAGAGQAWPTTLEAMIYPAGAFVKGTTPVIDLDTIYDSVGLSTNTYTAAFFEEGIFVANTCGSGLKVAIDISCLAGVTGAAELTCITTP